MSNINTNAIDVNYPVPGVNNNSQGFRDNTTAIKTNIDTAKTEITDLQNKVIVKTALTGTTVNNDMANTLISNALVRSFRATTYNLGSSLSGTILINVSLGDVQYGTITADTSIQFGGWAPSGTQSNVHLMLKIANSAATISFPNTSNDSGGNISTGMKQSIRSLENYSSNVVTSFAAPSITYTNIVKPATGVTDINYSISTVDCGSTMDIESTNRPEKTNQISVRTPANIGSRGDRAGTTCVDSNYLYVCNADYDGTTVIWKRVALTAF